jgi:tRNA uridine 5-carboxymethylaminomethyl modification enzyme
VGGETLERVLGRPSTTWEELRALHPGLAEHEADPSAVRGATIEAKYGGYIERQAEQVARFRRLEDKPIPPGVDFHAIPQLRHEAREALARVRPRSLGQAGRISGINPADLATLLVHLRRGPSPSGTAPETP